MKFSLNDAAIFAKNAPNEVRSFFNELISAKRFKMVQVGEHAPYVRMVFAGHENIEFNIEDIIKIDSEEKLQAFFDKKEKLNETENKAYEDAKAENLQPGDNEFEQLMDERAVDKEKMETYIATNDGVRDMLRTEVYPKGFTEEVRKVDAYVSDGDADMVKAVKEAYKEYTDKEEEKAEPTVEKAPEIAPMAKTMTLAPKEDKQSGFTEVLVLSVIVLVYVAIIVNLVIRLK